MVLIETSIDINAPIEVVWARIKQIDNWEWNKYFRLVAPEVKKGAKVTVKLSNNGDDKWTELGCEFYEVDDDAHMLSWGGKILGGILVSAKHHMKLTKVSENVTHLEHCENFTGLIPFLGLVFPYDQIRINYPLSNEALKKTIESENK